MSAGSVSRLLGRDEWPLMIHEWQEKPADRHTRQTMQKGAGRFLPPSFL
jgi:hypothetical protein